jgi:hypothetical protein
LEAVAAALRSGCLLSEPSRCSESPSGVLNETLARLVASSSAAGKPTASSDGEADAADEAQAQFATRALAAAVQGLDCLLDVWAVAIVSAAQRPAPAHTQGAGAVAATFATTVTAKAAAAAALAQPPTAAMMLRAFRLRFRVPETAVDSTASAMQGMVGGTIHTPTVNRPSFSGTLGVSGGRAIERHVASFWSLCCSSASLPSASTPVLAAAANALEVGLLQRLLLLDATSLLPAQLAAMEWALRGVERMRLTSSCSGSRGLAPQLLPAVASHLSAGSVSRVLRVIAGCRLRTAETAAVAGAGTAGLAAACAGPVPRYSSVLRLREAGAVTDAQLAAAL